MPLARISLRRGRSPAFLKALSDNVHRALVEAFEVPPDDRFQIIHQHEPEELIFDRHYLCGPRSDNYVLVCITAGRHRTSAVKQAFYRRLAELLADAPGIQPEDVMVVVNTTEAEDWSFGRGIAAVPKVSIQEESR
ncbi:tautomerase family protein [Cystobacter fuscus]|uniref:tautomerase family protein n=1 Tax=Cystobacter fuscus TaxID=43 RepID=UPI002B2E8ABC|nr:tautomerase family protein [Cystobacter fuscus]